jgi:hypothetical protein
MKQNQHPNHVIPFIFPAAWARSQPTTAPASDQQQHIKTWPYSNSLRLLKPMPIRPYFINLLPRHPLYGYYAPSRRLISTSVVCFVSMEINFEHVLIRRKCFSSQMILYLFCRPVNDTINKWRFTVNVFITVISDGNAPWFYLMASLNARDNPTKAFQHKMSFDR